MKGSWTTKALSSFEYGGGVTIMREAERKKGEKLLNRIRGFDLFACEAKYHKSCRTQYLQKPEKWRSKSDELAVLQNKLEEVHIKAFKHVCEILEDEVIDRNKIVKLSNLRKEYAKILETTEFANPDYRGEKLKIKIEKSEQFKEKLSFYPLGDDTRFHSYVIFSRNIDIGDAITSSDLQTSFQRQDLSCEILFQKHFQNQKKHLGLLLQTAYRLVQIIFQSNR